MVSNLVSDSACFFDFCYKISTLSKSVISLIEEKQMEERIISNIVADFWVGLHIIEGRRSHILTFHFDISICHSVAKCIPSSRKALHFDYNIYLFFNCFDSVKCSSSFPVVSLFHEHVKKPQLVPSLCWKTGNLRSHFVCSYASQGGTLGGTYKCDFFFAFLGGWGKGSPRSGG